MIGQRAAICGLMLGAAMLPLAAAAKQAHSPGAPVQHAAKPVSEPPAHAPDKTAKPPVPAPVKSGEGVSDLKSALARIDQQIRQKSHTPEVTHRAAAVQAPGAAAPRVRLRWRLGLTWPPELDAGSPRSTSRITLSWR